MSDLIAALTKIASLEAERTKFITERTKLRATLETIRNLTQRGPASHAAWGTIYDLAREGLK